MTDKISIIIPAYNVEKYIFRAIESALGQSYSDIEVVAVDDGSADSTWDIIQAYAEKDSRVLALHKSNGGVSSARNLALSRAGGEYVIFLDSDDWLEPDTVELLAAMQEENPGYLVSASYNNVSMGEDGTMQRISSAASSAAAQLGSLEAMCHVGTHSYGLTSACYKLFDLPLMRSRGVKFEEDVHYCEDALFVLRYLGGCSGLVYNPAAQWNILERAGSATSNGYSPRMRTAVTAAERMLEYIPDCSRVRDALILNIVSKTELVEGFALRDSAGYADEIAYYRRKLRSYARQYGQISKPAKLTMKYYLYAYMPTALLRLLVR